MESSTMNITLTQKFLHSFPTSLLVCTRGQHSKHHGNPLTLQAIEEEEALDDGTF